MKSFQRKKCCHCEELFHSDPRIAKRQEYCRKAGINLRQIQTWLGHSSPSTTSVYTHLTEKATTVAVKTINELMDDL